MRKYTPLAALLLAVFLIGCSGQASPTADPAAVPTAVVEPTDNPSPEAEPTALPSPSDASDAPTQAPDSGSVQAVCVQADAEFPLQPGLPPVTADEHTKGSSDARITVIEYSDFQ